MKISLQQAIVQASSHYGRNVIPSFGAILPYYGCHFRVTFDECIKNPNVSLDSGSRNSTDLFHDYIVKYALPELDINVTELFEGYDTGSNVSAVFTAEFLVRPVMRELYEFQNIVADPTELSNSMLLCLKKGHDAIIIPVDKFAPNQWMRGYEAKKAGQETDCSEIIFNTSVTH